MGGCNSLIQPWTKWDKGISSRGHNAQIHEMFGTFDKYMQEYTWHIPNFFCKYPLFDSLINYTMKHKLRPYLSSHLKIIMTSDHFYDHTYAYKGTHAKIGFHTIYDDWIRICCHKYCDKLSNKVRGGQFHILQLLWIRSVQKKLVMHWQIYDKPSTKIRLKIKPLLI